MNESRYREMDQTMRHNTFTLWESPKCAFTCGRNGCINKRLVGSPNRMNACPPLPSFPPLSTALMCSTLAQQPQQRVKPNMQCTAQPKSILKLSTSYSARHNWAQFCILALFSAFLKPFFYCKCEISLVWAHFLTSSSRLSVRSSRSSLHLFICSPSQPVRLSMNGIFCCCFLSFAPHLEFLFIFCWEAICMAC